MYKKIVIYKGKEYTFIEDDIVDKIGSKERPIKPVGNMDMGALKGVRIVTREDKWH